MPHAHSIIAGWDSVVRYHLVPVLVARMFAAYAKSSAAFRAMLVGAEAMYLVLFIQEDDVRLSFLLLAIPLLVLLSYSLEV